MSSAPSLLPTARWSPEDLLWVERFLGIRVPFSFYFQCQREAMADPRDTRRLYIGRARKGVILCITFDGIDVFTAVGALDEDELRLITTSTQRAELHVERDHVGTVSRMCQARIRKIDDVLYYRLDAQTRNGDDPRCRLLTPAHYDQTEAFFRRFYPATVFSRWMLALPFCGLFEGDELIAAGGTVVWSKAAQTCIVGNFLTHPAHRGRGLAKAVVQYLVASLRDEDMRTLILATTSQNQSARRVYESVGFVAAESLKQIDLRKG
jgi:RimJ/RimL family protein N-acetyltransferase